MRENVEHPGRQALLDQEIQRAREILGVHSRERRRKKWPLILLVFVVLTVGASSVVGLYWSNWSTEREQPNESAVQASSDTPQPTASPVERQPLAFNIRSVNFKRMKLPIPKLKAKALREKILACQDYM